MRVFFWGVVAALLLLPAAGAHPLTQAVAPGGPDPRLLDPPGGSDGPNVPDMAVAPVSPVGIAGVPCAQEGPLHASATREDDGVRVAWSAAGGEVWYYALYRWDGEGGWTHLADVDATVREYLDEYPVPDPAVYAVRAAGPCGVSPPAMAAYSSSNPLPPYPRCPAVSHNVGTAPPSDWYYNVHWHCLEPSGGEEPEGSGAGGGGGT